MIERVAQSEYIKIHCPLCGGHIEFPSSLAGQRVGCPHCKEPIELSPGEGEAANSESGGLRLSIPTPAQASDSSSAQNAVNAPAPAVNERRALPKALKTVLTVAFTLFVMYISRFLLKELGFAVVMLAAGMFLCWWLGNQVLEGKGKHFVPSFAIHAGLLLWVSLFAILSGNYFLLVGGVAIEAGVLIWLVSRPSIPSVVAVTVIHCWGIGLTLNVPNLANVPEKAARALVTLVLLVRLPAIVLAVRGYRRARVGS